MISPDVLDELREVLVLLDRDPAAAREALLRIVAEAERELAWATLHTRLEQLPPVRLRDGAR